MEKIFNYKPQGVCAADMTFKVKDNTLVSYECVGGCPGNYMGIKALIEGVPLAYIINKLKDIKCGFKDTSCPQEIAKALLEFKKSNSMVEIPKEIKLCNRYGLGVKLVKMEDEYKYLLAFDNEEDGNCMREGRERNGEISFIDPSGGPFIKVGSSLTTMLSYSGLGDDEKVNEAIRLLEVMSIERGEKGYVLTLI